MHFRISSSLNIQRKTKRHVFLLLFVLTPVHLNWPSYATGKCYRSPRQLISTMKHWWLYITIHSLTIFKRKMRNLILNLIYLSFLFSIVRTHLISAKIHKSEAVYFLISNDVSVICSRYINLVWTHSKFTFTHVCKSTHVQICTRKQIFAVWMGLHMSMTI